MTQQSKYDKIILKMLQDGKIESDHVNGLVYGQSRGLGGRRVVGCTIGKESFFTFVKKDGKTVNYPICRIIYLSKYGSIRKGYKVYHINGDLCDNRVSNLDIIYKKKVREGKHWWKKSEEEFLKKNYKKMSYSELSEKLGRSIKSVRYKLKRINLKKENVKKIWSDEDDKKLISIYRDGSLSLNEIALILGKSSNSVRLRANRINGLHRSDRHLRDNLNENSFYNSAKGAFQRGTLRMKCCLCDYNKYIHLHHIDGDRKNNHISNMSTLCPNHHSEITHGEHKDEFLYAIWARVYSRGSIGDEKNNIREIREKVDG